MMRRIVSVWLIDWPVSVRRRSLERARRPASPPDPALDPQTPFALILKNSRGAAVIHALNPAARATGLRRGQTQADALAMIPYLLCQPADAAADGRALKALAIWAERWSPSVSLDPSDEGLEGLFLDVTGATHLFGGEAVLLDRIRTRLAETGTTARVAMAPTPGAAWALARWSEGQDPIATDDTVADLLADLPVEALRLDDRTVSGARRLGLKTIGHLYAMPRAGLAKRFRDGDAIGLVKRLDQARGYAAEALTPVRPPARYRVWQAFAEPLGDVAGVEARLPELAADLSRALERDGQGAKALTLTGFRTDGETTSLSVRMGLPGRDASIWMRLFREAGFGRLELGFGLDALMLTADLTEPMLARQGVLESEAETKQAESLALLIDRLTARLGADRVLTPEPVDSWIPERAERLRPALGRVPAVDGTAVGRRPILLLDPPEPIEDPLFDLPEGAPARFTWRRVSRRIVRAEGPERLSPEWWRPRPDGREVRTRDYYRIHQARALGIAAVGVADRNTLAGMVRAAMEAETLDLPLIIGARLVFTDGTPLIVFPRDRAAYGRLCRLLSLGKSEVVPQPGADPEGERIEKAETRLTFEQAVALGEGMIALAPAPETPDAAFEARLGAWRAAWPDDLYLAASPLWRGDDRRRLNRLAAMAERTGAPMIATNAVLYHHVDRRMLQDVLTCIREGTTIDKAGRRLQANAERDLKTPARMAHLFRGHEAALDRTMEVARACTFSLRELQYQYPDEPVPSGWTAQRRLMRLTFAGAREKWPDGVPMKVRTQIRDELKLIKLLKYPNYFLTVHDIVAWARGQEKPILCQGRGSAANSVVCFCLGVTNVNPAEQDVLIERFMSADRDEPPDIDVDFEHERREEVMQYVYRRYGRDRAAIVATIIHYRPRSAIRDVGKALGLTEDVTARMADTVWGSWGDAVKEEHVDRTGLSRDDARMQLALQLTAEIIKFPRHLSQHVGGYVLSQTPLLEIVPIGNAAMDDRTFIEWDKDDIDWLKLMKVDVLALGMLTALRRGFDLIADSYGDRFELDTVPQADAGVYDMLCKGDSVGVFQVESRAQMAMLPRLRPEVFYDLVVEVAIVRPGPIQGGMVHPYLKRRKDRREARARGEPFRIDYPSPSPEHGPADELKQVLHKTLGVPLFQEQAMRIAMQAAKYTPAEANSL
ncbi:MAG: hypothetical protein EON85_09535, partial [Brevundimonas sp.]